MRLLMTGTSLRRPLRISLLIPVVCLIGYTALSGRLTRQAGFSARASQTPPLRTEPQITVRAAGRGNPWLSLGDGHDLPNDATTAGLLQSAAPGSLQARALATADFDEDGVPDLVSSYATGRSGRLMLQRGNADSIYPNTPEARLHRLASGSTGTPEPLSPTTMLAEVPEAPDFLAAGDFDADGHPDVVMAARGSSLIYLLAGNGHGGFNPPQSFELPGRITALAAGEINRADGLADLIAGIDGTSGPQALIYEGPEGALKSRPEAISLPAPASDFAPGQLDDDYPQDLAVACGHSLLIVHGRDRQTSLSETMQAQVQPAVITRQDFADEIKSVVIGDFTGSHRSGLALLTVSGAVQLLAHPEKQQTLQQSRTKPAWQTETVSSGAWPQAARLVIARVSSHPFDNLILIDSASHQLHILDRGASAVNDASLSSELVPVTIDVAGEPAAVLPMRLNSDALSDLVILKNSQHPLAYVPSVAQATFVVTNTNDSGPGSLRQAILAANSSEGPDSIIFRLDGTAPFTISPTSPLPIISDTVTLDGTTQPGFTGSPVIELSGAITGTGAISFTGGNSVLRGLVINRFNTLAAHALNLFVNGNNIIEGNFIGTDVSGRVRLGNGGDGIRIISVSGNIIGGTVPAARNVISGNGLPEGGEKEGIIILANVSDERPARNNQVLGNYLGTDVTGTTDIGNAGSGIRLAGSGQVSDNIIGGTTAGARNLISGNDLYGIVIQSPTDTTSITGNFIGTDLTGTKALGNTGAGIIIFDSDNNSIGGTASGAGNVIAFNSGNGITVASGTGDAIQSNSIFSNSSPGIDLGGQGVTLNDAGDADTGANNLQNFPVLTRITISGQSETIQGTLNSTANTTFRVEFFANTSSDPTGYGEGERFIGATSVTTDNAGNSSFAFTAAASNGLLITATATDPNGNTSEFSRKALVAGLSLTQTATPNPVIVGNNLTYTITVTNNGPDPATNVRLTGTPAGSFQVVLITTSAPQGSCGPAETGLVCSLGTLPSGASATATVILKTTATGTISNLATVSASETDPDPSDNQSQISVSVIRAASTVSLASSRNPSQYTDAVTFTATVQASQSVTPTGTVTFRDGQTVLGTGVLNAAGQAALTVPGNLPVMLLFDELPLQPVNGLNFNGVGFDFKVNGVNSDDARYHASGPRKITYVDDPSLEGTAAGTLTLSFAVPTTTLGFGVALDSQLTLTPGFTVQLFDAAGQQIQNRSVTTTRLISFSEGRFDYSGVPVSRARITFNPSGNRFAFDNLSYQTTLARLAPGSHPITAQYNGNEIYVSGISPTLIQVVGGTPAASITQDGRPLAFSPTEPLRFPDPNSPPLNFSIRNSGTAPLELRFDSLLRAAGASQTLTNPDDSALFPIDLTRPGGFTSRLTYPTTIRLEPGETVSGQVRFNPLIPTSARTTTGLSANQVLPDEIASKLTISNNAGAPLTIDLLGRINPKVRLIHPVDRLLAPLVLFSRSGDEFTVEYTVFDPNLDVSVAQYEFLDSSSQPIRPATNVDFGDSIRQAGIVRGQAFTVTQKFLEASQFPQAVKVRVTVYDGFSDSALSLQLNATEPRATTVSAASYSETALTSNAIVAAFGPDLARTTRTAPGQPLPTTLDGTTVQVRDGAGIERLAPLFFVSPGQVNYLIPAESVSGAATVTVTGANGAVARGMIQIASVAPSLFAANSSGQGVAAALALRVKADGSQQYEAVAQFDEASHQFIFRPLDFGPADERLFLILFGTGMRNLLPSDTVRVSVGGTDAPVLYAGAQGSFAGLDQVNVELPRTLADSGLVDISLAINSRAANPVQIRFGNAATASGSATTAQAPDAVAARLPFVSGIVLPPVRLGETPHQRKITSGSLR